MYPALILYYIASNTIPWTQLLSTKANSHSLCYLTRPDVFALSVWTVPFNWTLQNLTTPSLQKTAKWSESPRGYVPCNHSSHYFPSVYKYSWHTAAYCSDTTADIGWTFRERLWDDIGRISVEFLNLSRRIKGGCEITLSLSIAGSICSKNGRVKWDFVLSLLSNTV
jgi:hypothetical protein